MGPSHADPADRPLDPMAEIAAMTAVAEALKPLVPDQIERVLEWANKHYLKRSLPVARVKSMASAAAATDSTDPETDPERVDFPSLLGSARATSGIDRVLLAGYYFQAILGQGDFDGFSLNRELKNAGHASGNITRDLDGLMAKTPQLVIQTRKQGTSRQARKLYRLTAAGLQAAKALTGPGGAIE